jgi:KipI family sensor histidine kinase inhibitor
MSAPSSPGWSTESLAEDALLLRFGDAIDAGLNARVHAAAERLRQALPQVECVPAYASLLLRFDPRAWPGEPRSVHQRLADAVGAALRDAPPQPAAPRMVEIPTWYGDEAGPDLAEVAALTGLSAEEVVRRHCAAEYRVAMLGFAPGFAYLLGLDPALAVARRADPRLRVPAGSVAIGGSQTGIYPGELPGGWQLIGRTPLTLFDPQADTPSLLAPGDRVRFRAVDPAGYRRLLDEAQR